MFSLRLLTSHNYSGQTYEMNLEALPSVSELIEGMQGYLEEKYGITFPHSKTTGKLASGFVARLAVTRKVKQENGKLKSTRESMQLMSKNLEDCPSSCSRPSDPTLPSSCAVHIYLQNSQQKEGGCVQFCGGTLSIP